MGYRQYMECQRGCGDLKMDVYMVAKNFFKPGVEAGDASCDEAETGGISGITNRASRERIRCLRFLS